MASGQRLPILFLTHVVCLHLLLLEIVKVASTGNYFDCDPINKGRKCLCAHGETGVWDIQCPARILEVYPVTVKLAISRVYPDEAAVRIICDPAKPQFQWNLIQGFDLEAQNLSLAVTSMEISYCPVISTNDLQNVFHQLKLEPEDIQSFSYLTWKANTSFPSDFLKLMPNLEILDLRNNGMTDLPSFQGLEYLNQINLRGNNITFILPDTFSFNPNLEQIRMGGNHLSSLEKPVFPNSLILLDLVDNRITKISNESLANLHDLRILYLNNNPLERVEAGAFSQLKNLTELSLDYSRLFTFPVLKDLPKLANLSISYSLFSSTKLIASPSTNGLLEPDPRVMLETETENTNFYSSTSPTGKGGDDDAETISQTTMNNNGKIMDDLLLTGVTTAGDSSAGRSLMITDPDDMDIETEDMLSFNEAPEKSEENSAGMNIQNEQIIGDLFALKKLILVNDDLKSLSWMGFLPNLTDLVLSRNEIQVIPEGFFRNLPSVKHVDLSKNSISSLSELSAPLLTFLDLSNNFIPYLDQNYFQTVRKLKVLSLASNKIDYIHPKAFEHLQDLVILDLSNNQISFEQGTLPMYSRQVGLMSMLDEDQADDQVPTTSTTSEKPDTIIAMDYSEDEKVSNSSPLQYCTKLEKIMLRNNLITRVFTDWTFVPKHLKLLDLSRNKIKSIHPRDLHFVSQDVRFDLRYNEISNVDMDFAELLLESVSGRKIVVMLDGNPIHCDCHAIAFKKFNVKSYKLHYADMRCASPPTLQGRKFTDVPSKELKCMITQSCPSGCSCWELPSENLIKMDCNTLKFGTANGKKSTLKGFMEMHEPLEFEMDLSGKKLGLIDQSFMKDISTQMRLINLTRTGLSSIEFLDKLSLNNNNVTKFAVSKNPFKCGGCEFQKTWWKHYKRIVDIRDVTCLSSEQTKSSPDAKNTKSPEIISFYDLVKRLECRDSNEAISDEIRFLMISLGVLVPLIVALLICCGHRQQRESAKHKTKIKSKERSLKKTLETSTSSAASSLHHHHHHVQRSYSPTRSKVADMDNSKF